jgi:NAD+ synthase
MRWARAGALRDAALPLHLEGSSDAAACAEGARRPLRHRADRRAGRGLRAALAPLFEGQPRADITEENLQSRARGTILMAISNKFGPMVVTTGNKSEMSVGYATLYGDMNGGFNPIKDLYKTEVYRCRALAQRAGRRRAGPPAAW